MNYFSDVEKLAKMWNCAFFETSPKNNENIDEVFEVRVRKK